MRTRDQGDDLQALRRMLPVPAERDFPAGRLDQREEHLMNSLLTSSSRPDRRRRLALRVAVPVGLAAAAAGVAITVLPGGPASQPQAAAPSSAVTETPARPSRSPSRITTASYTVERKDNSIVTLTVTDPTGKLDPTRLQKDLDRMGVPSRVLAGDPNCRTQPRPEENPSTTPSGFRQSDAPLRQRSAGETPLAEGQVMAVAMKHGKTVLYVRPRAIPAGQEIMVGFPYAHTDPAMALAVVRGSVIDDNAPYCLPAPPTAQ
ncbi:hypothetical protein AB5J55_43900 [Streptomyces sp. R11]|uniref:Serine/threonine protein kinase n=1 Tax=Streptomyces sp. R11 TaxID=3238625 RepID=A0AB39NGR3_9ACTN